MLDRRDIIHLSDAQEGFESGGRRSLLPKAGAIVVALLVTCGLLAGYSLLSKRNRARALQAQTAKQEAMKPAPSPEAQVFQDEARLKGGQAIISGAVQNISRDELNGLAVEIELKRRDSKETARRTVNLEPSGLKPGEEGRYSLTVPSSEWGGMQVVRLLSAGRSDEVAFKSALGQRRPPEPSPGKTKVVVVQRPRAKGEEFINTEGNPERVP